MFRAILIRCLCLALVLIGCARADGTDRATVGTDARAVAFRTRTMGTWATLTLVTADSSSAAPLAYRSLRTLHRVDSLMSNWTETSEVARINRVAARQETLVDPELAVVLTAAARIGRASSGAFDITVEPLVRLWGFLGGTPRVPEPAAIEAALTQVGWDKLEFDAARATLRFSDDRVRIDLGGIAKGYGVDLVAEFLRAAKIENALVDLSGNMVAIGNAPTGDGWTVGIRDPEDRVPYLGRLRLRDEAVATSADYEQFVTQDGKRYGHIIDPRSGWPASGLASVTVVSSRAMDADAWATALIVLGVDEARRTTRGREDIAVILVEADPKGGWIVWIEEKLRSRFDPAADSRARVTVHGF